MYRGREVKTTGDGFLAIFDSATRAVRCAAAMTRSARAMGLHIRVGIHTGEVEFSGGDARGIAVSCGRPHPLARRPRRGARLVDDERVARGLRSDLEDAGTHELKGLSRRAPRLSARRRGHLTIRSGRPGSRDQSASSSSRTGAIASSAASVRGQSRISTCVKPPARNARSPSAISSAEPRRGIASASAAPVTSVGSTMMPADRPIEAGSRPTSRQAASSAASRGANSARSAVAPGRTSSRCRRVGRPGGASSDPRHRS